MFYQAVVAAVLLYGIETWVVSIHDLRPLALLQNGVVRNRPEYNLATRRNNSAIVCTRAARKTLTDLG